MPRNTGFSVNFYA